MTDEERQQPTMVHDCSDEQEITARLDKKELVKGWNGCEGRELATLTVVRVAARTDLGRVRENNEDKFDFYEPEAPSVLAARGSFYAVADGMGGHAAGQIASELALKNTLGAYYNGSASEPSQALLDAVAVANDIVFNIAAMIPERKGMGTTLTVTVVIEDRVLVAQVGDSRAYMIRDGQIRQVTEDHSWVAEQVRMGVLTEEQAENSPYKNVITRCIGTQRDVVADLYDEKAHAGDIWILCSDGLSGHLEAAEILQIANENGPSEAARQMVDLANARGGRDNITVLVFVIQDVIRLNDAAPVKKKGLLSIFRK